MSESMIGKKFGRLTVLSVSRKRAMCQCECGEVTEKAVGDLRSGDTKSCGCLRREATAKRSFKHGHCVDFKPSDVHCIWRQMIQRCTNPKDSNYKNYGARGITVCARWMASFNDFISDVGPRPSPGHSLDRKNADLGYTPENVEWATATQQSRNRRPRSNTGVAGVGYSYGKYRAYICPGNRLSISLGAFDDFFEAVAARKSAEIALWGGAFVRLDRTE